MLRTHGFLHKLSIDFFLFLISLLNNKFTNLIISDFPDFKIFYLKMDSKDSNSSFK